MAIYNSTSYSNNEANRSAARAVTEASSASRDVQQLEDRLDRLILVCRAMWELLREKSLAVEEELVTKVAVLDAADGVADGKQTQVLRKCRKCDRPLQRRATKCLYCKAELVLGSVFETV